MRSLMSEKVGLMPITGKALELLLSIDNRVPQDPYDEPAVYYALPPYRSGPIHKSQRIREFWHRARVWMINRGDVNA